MKKFIIVIPARLASSRLPSKPLINIDGKSLIRRTFEQCCIATKSDNIYVATDHKQIFDHCVDHDIQVIMTSDQCLTGTDRVAEVSQIIDAEYYINVQGDEPLINPADIKKMIYAVQEGHYDVLNGYALINNENDYLSRSIPKVVVAPNHSLIYMSRAGIPANKSGIFDIAWRQICIYAFNKKSLEAFSECKNKTPLESIEDIEILRFIELGYNVHMLKMTDKSIAVDHPEDLEKVSKQLDKRSRNLDLILWDFDGVIVNSDAIREYGFKQVLKEYPKEEVDKLLHFHRMNGGLSRYVKFRYFFEKIKNEVISDLEVNQLAAQFSKIMMTKMIDKKIIIDQTIHFIEQYNEKIPMYIVSGSDQEELRKLCESLGISKYFKNIFGSPRAKSLLVADVLSIHKHLKEVVLIGDSINDYEAARDNDIHFFGYNNYDLLQYNSIDTFV